MSRGLDRDVDDLRDRPSSWNHRGRDWERPEREPNRVRTRVLDRELIPVDRDLPDHDLRDVVQMRDRIYRLRQTEFETLQEIGRFRVIDERDLERFQYADDKVRSREDLRSLSDQGLIERPSVTVEGGQRLPLATLTARQGSGGRTTS